MEKINRKLPAEANIKLRLFYLVNLDVHSAVKI